MTVISTFATDGSRSFWSKNKVRKNNVYLLYVKEYKYSHLKLNQEDATNIMGKGKASQTLCSFVKLLFHNKNKSNYQFNSIETPFLLSTGTILHLDFSSF